MSKRQNQASPTVSFATLFDHWWRHHLRSAKTSFTRQLQKPLQHMLTALVIGIALALPALLLIAVENVRELGQRWDGAPQVSVFMPLGASEQAQLALREQLSTQANVAEVQLIPPAQALAEMEKSMNIEGTETLLGGNPLPAVVAVKFSQDADEAAIEKSVALWQGWDSVEKVDADFAWIKKLFQMIEVAERIVLLLVVLLGAGALLSVGSMIKLAIENRRDEIVIASLVGATESYVRRPFLYSGFWYGLSGGIVALILLLIGYYSVIQPVTELLALYQAEFVLQGVSVSTALGVIATGVGLGVVGAWLAVGQHLLELRPR